MIDALDKQTQPLPFEPAKRGRGRPRTGNAMTPAEKQRAYRERQKAAAGNVTEKEDQSYQVRFEELRAIAIEVSERCRTAENRVKELERLLVQRNERQERVKRHRDQPAAELPEEKTYTLQARTGSGKWQNLVAGIYGEEASRQLDRVIDNKIAGSKKQYRLVEDGCV